MYREQGDSCQRGGRLRVSEKSEGIKQKKKILIKTNNSIVITREKEGWEEAEECKWGINGDRRKFELGWSTHNTIYR